MRLLYGPWSSQQVARLIPVLAPAQRLGLGSQPAYLQETLLALYRRSISSDLGAPRLKGLGLRLNLTECEEVKHIEGFPRRKFWLLRNSANFALAGNLFCGIVEIVYWYRAFRKICCGKCATRLICVDLRIYAEDAQISMFYLSF